MANKVTTTNTTNKVVITPQSTKKLTIDSGNGNNLIISQSTPNNVQITNNDVNTSLTPNNVSISSTDNSISLSSTSTPVTVTQGTTSVVTVNTQGPRGPQGSGITSGEDIDVRNITASGNISASGNIIANRWNNASDETTNIQVLDGTLVFQANSEANNALVLNSAGAIFNSNNDANRDFKVGTGTTDNFLVVDSGNDTLTIAGNITSSGDISSSGNIITNDITLSSDGLVDGSSALIRLQGLGDSNNLQESIIGLDSFRNNGEQAITFTNIGAGTDGVKFIMHGANGFYARTYYMTGDKTVAFQQNYRAANDSNGDTAFTFNNAYYQPTGYLFTVSHRGNPQFRIGNNTGSIEFFTPITASGAISASGDIIGANISGSGLFISGAGGITVRGNKSTSGSIKFFDNDTTASIELAIKDNNTGTELSGIFAGRGNEGNENGYLGWTNVDGGSQNLTMAARNYTYFLSNTNTIATIKDFGFELEPNKRLIVNSNITASGNISSSSTISGSIGHFKTIDGFISGDGNNRVLTSDGDGTFTAENDFTYNGTTFALQTQNIDMQAAGDGFDLTGNITASNDISASGDIEASGLILTSPNGTRYRITVEDDGTLNIS